MYPRATDTASALAFLCALAGAGCNFDATGAAAGGDGADAATPDGPASPDAPPPPAAHAKTITIDGTKVAGELADFPVYVLLVDADLRSRATADGSDIYFVDGSGDIVLDHELQRWDAETGRLEAWVRVPALSAGLDVAIQLRYGDASVAPEPNPAGVWRNGFVAVWHMEQSPAGGLGAIVDSAGSSPGTAGVTMDDTSLVAAVLGSGVKLDGDDDEITFDNPLPGASPHTISAWVDQQVTNSNDALVVLGNGACGQARWFHSRFTGGAVAAGFFCDDFTATGTDIQGQGPTLLHWTYSEDSNSRLYRDGALALGPLEHAGTQSTIGELGRIGNAPATFGQNMGLDAVVDEVRIATVARAPEWIATEFANQSSPDTFYSIGPERPVP